MKGWVAKLGSVLLVVGCNDVGDSTTATLDMRISTFDPVTVQGPPLEGAELCQTETTNCDLSDSRGRASIQLPVGEEMSCTIEKEGHVSHLLADVVRDDRYETFALETDRDRAREYERLDSPYPMRGTGAIVIELHPEVAGVIFELVGATGKEFYVDEEGNWTPNLSATTSGGSSRSGGGFVEVTPGEYQVELGGTAESCVRQTWGWPGDRDNSVRLPVQENHESYVIMSCTTAQALTLGASELQP